MPLLASKAIRGPNPTRRCTPVPDFVEKAFCARSKINYGFQRFVTAVSHDNDVTRLMGCLEEAGLGAHAMWGYTPAKDLLQETPIKGEVSILVCQPGDIGHVLRTISSRRRHPEHTINLYVWESQPEVLARHLLLLQVAQDWELPIRQRANLFLEIFGNSFVQERTSLYIARKGKKLADMLHSMRTMSDVIDLSLLKCRQRDILEEVFKYWSSDNQCDMTTLRDCRLRRFFGTRYDHRKNLVDWDYTTRLKEVAGIIHHKQYRGWRLDGIAYEFGDQIYDQPNRTMVSYAVGTMLKGQDRGMKKEIRGFWLDIRVGPFITFGVACDCPNKHAEALFTIHNKGTGTEQYRHNTAEVAVYSVLSYFWALEAGAPYLMTKAHDIYSGLGEDASKHALGGGTSQDDGEKLKEEDTSTFEEGQQNADVGKEHQDARVLEVSSVPSQQCTSGDKLDKLIENQDRTEQSRGQDAIAVYQCIIDTFDGVKVHVMSGDLVQHLSKTRFRHHFDRVHMGLTAVDAASNAAINEALADRAVITVDTGRYIVPFSKEQQRAFVRSTCSMAQQRGWQPLFDASSSADGLYVPANDGALSMDSIGFSFNRQPANA